MSSKYAVNIIVMAEHTRNLVDDWIQNTSSNYNKVSEKVQTELDPFSSTNDGDYYKIVQLQKGSHFV